MNLTQADLCLTRSQRLLMNSKGVRLWMSKSYVTLDVMCLAEEGTRSSGLNYFKADVARLDRLSHVIRSGMQDLRENALAALDGRKGDSYTGPVLFCPQSASILAALARINVSALRAREADARWKDKIGCQVASPKFSFSQKPLDESRPKGWMPFDREGTLSSDTEIIKDGVLQRLVHDRSTAIEFGATSTGNAMGPADAFPQLGMTNAEVQAGDSSCEELMAALGNGLMIKRFSGGSNYFTGAFSGVAKNAMWIKDGRPAYAVSNVMVQGNLFEALNNIVLVGKERLDVYGSLQPYILVDGVNVTAL